MSYSMIGSTLMFVVVIILILSLFLDILHLIFEKHFEQILTDNMKIFFSIFHIAGSIPLIPIVIIAIITYMSIVFLYNTIRKYLTS